MAVIIDDTTKPYIDLAIVAPLKVEYQRVTSKFPIVEETVDGTMISARIDVGRSDISAVVVLQDDMGKAAATRAADYLISRFSIGVICVVGIAGGLSGDVSVGDVCVSTNIVDVLENATVKESKGALTIELNSIFYGSNDRLEFIFKYYSLGHNVSASFEDWQLNQHYSAKKLISDNFIGRSGKNEVIGIPEIHDGYIVCGSVSKSQIYKSKLKDLGRKVLAVETESGGVFHSAKQADIPAVAVRGICDYADENKSLLEEQTNGYLRQIAADNAVSLLAAQVNNPQFLLFLEQRRQLCLSSTQLVLETKSQGQVEFRSSLQQEAHQQLTLLSPGYRGKAEGYRLPLPRVRPAASTATVHPSIQKNDPIDLLEAVTTNRVVVLEVPQNYPDNSLPWIIAAELSRIELHGKPAAPLVIDGDQIKPPSGNIENAVNIKFGGVFYAPGWRKVFIVDNFNAGSSSRINVLKAEIEKYPDATFVILHNNASAISNESRLVAVTGAVRYNICDISFAEIALFLQRNFKLADQEASVVAYRLHQLFRRFDLNAHPSYFAGVAGDVLSSLLKANRRSELIQLAVGGFLSFVVASDTDDVVLTRTTREAFLRELAFEMNFNLRKFDQKGLLDFISEFAEKKDYEIDPIKFVEAFREKAIIDFKDGFVKINLPFIESYLLASELVARPQDAARYFNTANDNFDFHTFDIYAELGADVVVVNNVVQELIKQAELLQQGRSESHILLTNELRPRYVERKGQIDAVKNRLVKAIEDVAANRDNSGQKQRILDLATKVEVEARKDREIASAESRTSKEDDNRTRNGFRVWAVATTLIGAGSERLDKEPKRKLASAIVTITTILLDRIMREFPRANFDKLREKMKSDELLREIFRLDPEKEIDDKLREFSDTFVDSYEFSLLTYPIRLMFEHIGEAAGQKVLRSSLASVQPAGDMDNLVTRIWGAEIDAVKEKAALIDAVKRLPPFPFFRLALSNHLLSRVFWDHWDDANRMAFLDVVEETLKPLSSNVDKGRIQRAIEKENRPKKESEMEI